MAIAQTDIKTYLTSVEPLVAQTNASQSVGGYASITLPFGTALLSSAISSTSTSITVNSIASITGKTKILIDREIIEVSAINSTTIAVTRRGANQTTALSHSAGAKVTGIGVLDLFNNDFNGERKQYRCLAIKNTNATDTAQNVSIYLRHNSINPSSSYKFAVEVPTNDAYSGTVTSGTLISLSDTSIPEDYEDNHLVGAVVSVTNGRNINQTRTVISYDADTSTVVLDSALPYEFLAGEQYLLMAGPCQRLLNGTVTPTFDTDNVSELSAGNDPDNAVLLSDFDRVNGGDLLPNDTVYVWIERSLSKNADPFDNNRMVLAIRFEH